MSEASSSSSPGFFVLMSREIDKQFSDAAASGACIECAWRALQHGEASAFRAYVQRIFQAYPPAAFSYVGIGASCDLLLEYIMLLEPNAKVANIPWSGMTNVDRDFTEAEEERLRGYILHNVGSDILADSSKRLVLMDVTSGAGRC